MRIAHHTHSGNLSVQRKLTKQPLTNWWVAPLASILLVAGGMWTGPVRAEVDIQHIIENVRANERLYENCEAVYVGKYVNLDESRRKSADPRYRFHVRADTRVRCVYQEGMFHLQVGEEVIFGDDGTIYGDEGTAIRSRVRLFDGETSRSLDDYTAIANIVAGPTVDDNMIRPHMVLLQKTGYAVPLSTYLTGHDAMIADPGMEWPANRHIQTEYLGEETFADLRCQKVMITHRTSTGKPTDARVLWLAVDRNYIPIHTKAYTYRISENDHVGEGAVHDLKEIESGIWFPFETEYTAYDKRLVRDERQFKPIWRKRYTVESVDMKPNYPLAFFRDLDFPDGTAVYEVEGGEIVRSYRVGAPGTEVVQKSGGHWWMVFGGLGALAIVACVFVVRRRRCS